ncbi:hypothetical protein SAMN05444404_0206 [Ruegeria lacuscaerulensis ITI-1157]|nr:hypothetical protein SAMN05444404_0206 [Ruegeria lacuscaerulensis ITI-1157]
MRLGSIFDYGWDLLYFDTRQRIAALFVHMLNRAGQIQEDNRAKTNQAGCQYYPVDGYSPVFLLKKM